jgi:hypothetical protein
MASIDEIQGSAGTSSSPISAATFVAHAKEYGLLYAIAYFVASDLGLLVKVTETVGGVC